MRTRQAHHCPSCQVRMKSPKTWMRTLVQHAFPKSQASGFLISNEECTLCLDLGRVDSMFGGHAVRAWQPCSFPRFKVINDLGTQAE